MTEQELKDETAEITAGESLERLMRDEHLASVIEKRILELSHQIRVSAPAERDLREARYFEIRALEGMKTAIDAKVAAGQMAKAAREKRAKQK